MESLERFYDDRHEQPPQGSVGGNPAGNLSRMQQAGEEFLKAGDEAIERALSGDSKAFLAANRQRGGE